MYVVDDLNLNTILDPTFGWWQGIHVGCTVNALEIAIIPVFKPSDHPVVSCWKPLQQMMIQVSTGG
jgi:hypothetical protein